MSYGWNGHSSIVQRSEGGKKKHTFTLIPVKHKPFTWQVKHEPQSQLVLWWMDPAISCKKGMKQDFFMSNLSWIYVQKMGLTLNFDLHLSISFYPGSIVEKYVLFFFNQPLAELENQKVNNLQSVLSTIKWPHYFNPFWSHGRKTLPLFKFWVDLTF